MDIRSSLRIYRGAVAIVSCCLSTIKCETHMKGQHGNIRVPVIDIIDNGHSGFSWPFQCQSIDGQHIYEWEAHALPFFAFIRSEISRLRARFGSKFCGSHALTVMQC